MSRNPHATNLRHFKPKRIDDKREGIRAREVKGQFNRMAVCDGCNRDATQTRISRYCIAALTGAPLLCDDCDA